jgi:hypothetical protein
MRKYRPFPVKTVFGVHIINLMGLNACRFPRVLSSFLALLSNDHQEKKNLYLKATYGRVEGKFGERIILLLQFFQPLLPPTLKAVHFLNCLIAMRIVDVRMQFAETTRTEQALAHRFAKLDSFLVKRRIGRVDNYRGPVCRKEANS